MTELNEQDLLELYAWNGSETAFKELVRRHTDLVYSTAIRLVRDPHLAEDVSQRAFVALAQHARKLSGRSTIAGWLHLTTRNFAVMTIRTEERRKLREQKAVDMFSDANGGEASWPNISAHLDEALSDLNEGDRDMVVLRYLERKTARETAERFGLSEEAAQKRTSRALKRLREALNSRGVTVSVLALGGIISVEAVKAAPAGLAGGLAVKALAVKVAAPTLVGTLLKPVTFVAQLKSNPVAAAVSLVACLTLATGGFVVGRAAASRHWTAVAWQNALSQDQAANSTLTNDGASGLGNSALPSGAGSTNPSRAEERPNVSEIFAEAAKHFRARDTDPDAFAKGLAIMQKLRPSDVTEARQQLEFYRGESGVYATMAPEVMGLWAQSDPRAALEYSLTSIEPKLRAMALSRVVPEWSRQEPVAAWAWYQQTSAAGKLPIVEGTWMWMPSPIFAGWAEKDPAGAIGQLATVHPKDERGAIGGIAKAAAVASLRAGILEAIPAVKDEELRRRLSAEVADQWAKMDPESAANWAAGLTFQNPAARMHVTGEALEKWWAADPHAAAVWLFEQAPGELMVQFSGLLKPDQLEKMKEAAR